MNFSQTFISLNYYFLALFQQSKYGGIVVVGAFVLIGVVVFLVLSNESKQNNKVYSHSEMLKKLQELNAQQQFYDVDDRFYVKKHYDVKSYYNKIEPAYLMTAEIRNNLSFYSDWCQKIKENRVMYGEYADKVAQIYSTVTEKECEALQISIDSYKKREYRLFEKEQLHPVLNGKFDVEMTYSSPKGKVNLQKSDTFDFDNMFACLESVSRSRMDRYTYEKMATVERGNVSDSMRYDIMRRDGFCCVICGASSKDGARLHIDHIVPISKGGKSEPNNLRTLCERCNIGKSNKTESATNENSGSDNACPNCGGKLVLRNGKYGQFFGCSNYPRCKYIKK